MQTTLTSKGQMTVPKAAREALGLKAGQRFCVEITADGGLLLRPIKLDPLAIAKVLGLPPHPVQLKDAEAIDQAIAKAVTSDWERVTTGRDDNDRD
jgi:AbrB family looped-hinge helix DNA binding protein